METHQSVNYSETVTMTWLNTSFSFHNNTNNTFIQVPYHLFCYQIAFGLHGYFLPVIIFIGLIGNSLSFLVMIKPRNRRIGCYNYMAALAVSDNLNLVFALDYWTLIFEKRPGINIECKIVAWLFQAISLSSMCFILSMTVDRFLAVRYPFKARSICSVYRARIIIVCISAVMMIYTLPYFFTAGLLSDNHTCVAVVTKDNFSVVYNWINIFLGSVIPFVSLLYMNIVIIFTIRKRSKDLKNSEKTENKNTNEVLENLQSKTDTKIQLGFISSHFQSGLLTTDMITSGMVTPGMLTSGLLTKRDVMSIKMRKFIPSKTTLKEIRLARDKQLTMMLLLVTFTFLLLTLPQYVRYLVAILWNYTTSPQDYANYILLVHISNKLFFLNSGCNFFLYCLSGRKFGQDLMRLFTCKL